MSMNDDHLRQAVREAYGSIAGGAANTGCCTPAVACCGPAPQPEAGDFSSRFGYSPEELSAVPEGSDLGLGCGNPSAIAAMAPGEVVVDLGSGAGFDCFLAARQVGPSGRVIGVDMTPEMLARARDNADKGGYGNVEFRLGEIESLPVADATADVVISNCVINLSPDKPAVLREAFRVLRPGGRLAVSDVVAIAAMPDGIAGDPELLCGCVAGAAPVADLTRWLEAAGFTGIRIRVRDESRDVIRDWAPGRGVERYVASATIEAFKPAAA